MRKFLETFASLTVAVLLLVLLLVGLAAGTIVESRAGVEVAGRAVYYAWWFLALQGAFALSVLGSLILHYPWGRERIGFLTLHGSLVLILVGAAVTFFAKTEGQLALWEGESGNVIRLEEPRGVITHTLPFTVKLLDFQIDRYPGTMRPAMFRSHVEVTDPAEGRTFAARIWMNNPLHYKGYSLFQSSYQQPRGPGGPEASVFSVSRDPGQGIVFLGYALLVLGMCIVLFTRVAQARKKAALEAALGLSGKATLAVLLASLAWPALALEGPRLEALRRLPVQHDGRTMPLDTQAREAVWKVTGSYRFQGTDPVATVMGWYFDPASGAQQPVVKLGSGDLAEAMGLPRSTRYLSFAAVVQNRAALQLMQEAHRLAAAEQPRRGALADAEKLEERLLVMQSFLDRSAVRSLPVPGDPVAEWGVAQVSSEAELAELSAGPRLPGWPSADAIERELTYMHFRPSQVSWIVLLGALVISILAWNGRSRLLDRLALAGLLLGLGVMAWGIGIRWQVAGRIPASNMYESLLWLAAGVGAFAVIAFAALRNRLVVLNANAMAALVMMLTDLLPIDRFIHPMAPVLSGTAWLAIHVPIIMVGYSVLALGMLVAHLQVGFTLFAPRRTDLVDRMAELNYWYMMVGSIFLAAGILTGSVWAASSWGRYWGWDPKEVWSLVAFLAYMAILHGRFDKIIGTFGVAAISILAFQTILMTYLGVNFVLTTGMHSYGFGDSPVVTWMVVVALAELTFVGAGWWAWRRRQVAAPAVRA
jgi:cytochrome c-type biogenesis protein CcsB